MSEEDIKLLVEVLQKLNNDEVKNEVVRVIQKYKETSKTYDWKTYIAKSHLAMTQHKNSKEIGKIRAYASELMLCDFLNHYARNLQSKITFIHNDELELHTSTLDELCLEKQQCQSGYDILCVNPITKRYKRIQVKHRLGSLHLETTRRNSKKNIGKNSSGHVSYGSNEFDFLIVVKGTFQSHVDMTKDIIVFPIADLVDKTKPEMLINRIPKAVERRNAQNLNKHLQQLCSMEDEHISILS